jgi:hypothetical protein
MDSSNDGEIFRGFAILNLYSVKYPSLNFAGTYPDYICRSISAFNEYTLESRILLAMIDKSGVYEKFKMYRKYYKKEFESLLLTMIYFCGDRYRDYYKKREPLTYIFSFNYDLREGYFICQRVIRESKEIFNNFMKPPPEKYKIKTEPPVEDCSLSSETPSPESEVERSEPEQVVINKPVPKSLPPSYNWLKTLSLDLDILPERDPVNEYFCASGLLERRAGRL